MTLREIGLLLMLLYLIAGSREYGRPVVSERIFARVMSRILLAKSIFMCAKSPFWRAKLVFYALSQ